MLFGKRSFCSPHGEYCDPFRRQRYPKGDVAAQRKSKILWVRLDQQQQNARPQQLQHNSVEQSSHSVPPPADSPSSA